MRTLTAFLLTVACVVITTGCAVRERGSLRNEAVSLSELHKRNYQVVKSNVRGDSYGFTFLIFPIVEPQLAEAKQEMYRHVEAGGTKLEGRPIFLANTTEEWGLYFTLLLFSISRVTLTADFMEFVGPESPEKPEKAPALHLVP